MSALVWKLLRQHISIGQLAGFFLANLFGMMIVLLSVQFYKDIIPIFTEGDSFMKKDFIIATKKISTLGSFAGKNNTFSAEDIADLKKQSFTKTIGAFTPSQFKVSAGLGMQEAGIHLSTDMFFESVPDEFVDIKLKIDDPVGAFSVHGVNGMWGGLAVGLFATGNGQDGITGLFYGGGFAQLGKQALGILCVASWTIVCMIIVFTIIKKTIGLRVTKEEEMKGLDICEHGLVSAYADFMPIGVGTASLDETFDVEGNVPVTKAVPVQLAGKYDMATDGTKITKIDILLKQSKLEALKEEMDKLGITGMTVSQVLGCGAQKGKAEYYRGVAIESNLLPKMKVEIVVCKVPVKAVVDAAVKALYTGHIGDGKIFIYDVEDVVKVRTGETGYDAMQDIE